MTIAESIVNSFDSGHRIGPLVRFIRDSGLVIEEYIDNTCRIPDEYVFRDSSIVFVNWQNRTITY